MLVYRDGRREVRPAELLDELARSLGRIAAAPSRQSEDLLTALLRAGALECALADAGCEAASVAAELTNALADAIVCGDNGGGTDPTLRAVKTALRMGHTMEMIELPATVRVSAPEGFAYYALDPLDYAAAADGVAMRGRAVCVVGLRTIGATLSAVVAAAARRRGARVERLTVRPSGHPFDRRTEFPAEQRRTIAEAAARRALFCVVDEGPGLSGSSLLSVVDALTGIACSDIVVFCAHAPNVATLRAPRAAERWAQLRVVTAGRSAQPPADAATDWSGGRWRAHLYADAALWPAAWPQVERLKFGSGDGARVYKFEGLGPYGEAPLERSCAAAEAGWGPAVEIERNGFAAYTRIHGRPLSIRDLDATMLETLARYCDFRQREMRADSHPSGRQGGPQDGAQASLREMLRVNLQEEFGIECEPGEAGIARPVIADGRLMPHEWLRDGDGRIWKTDMASHGDDHFYPGPTDIAWDLAGAIVEWRMEESAAQAFVERYRRLSGDDARGRLPFFLRAYSAFRLGFCRMAAEACVEERERLTNSAEYYRSRLLPVAQLASETNTSAAKAESPAPPKNFRG